ncbi:MAG: hypothetical protein AAF628_36740 [Planctomycetota bacterium]
MHVMLGAGDGSFSPPIHYLGNDSGIRFLRTGDADGDGDVVALGPWTLPASGVHCLKDQAAW